MILEYNFIKTVHCVLCNGNELLNGLLHLEKSSLMKLATYSRALDQVNQGL